MRYANLSTVLVYRLMSTPVKQRFPDYESLVKAKLMTNREVELLKKIEETTPHEVTWAPILWATQLLTKAQTEGKTKVPANIFGNIIGSFQAIEGANRKMLSYGWVNFPLAYTQVATFAVYIYFAAALFGRQYLDPHPDGSDEDSWEDQTFSASGITVAKGKSPFKHTPDFVVPFFTMIEFLCYYGWIKVGETLLNPFGDDDEDFQINYLIDRNLQVCGTLTHIGI